MLGNIFFSIVVFLLKMLFRKLVKGISSKYVKTCIKRKKRTNQGYERQNLFHLMLEPTIFNQIAIIYSKRKNEMKMKHHMIII